MDSKKGISTPPDTGFPVGPNGLESKNFCCHNYHDVVDKINQKHERRLAGRTIAPFPWIEKNFHIFGRS
jgi:hypothetical protein